MNKKLLLPLFFITCSFVNAMAKSSDDNTHTETLFPQITPYFINLSPVYSWKDNWYIDIHGGFASFIGSCGGNNDKSDKICSTLFLSLGKWHSPSTANRIALQYFRMKNNGMLMQDYFHWHTDILWNILPHSSDDNSFRINISPIFGLGIIDNRTSDHCAMAINYGIQTAYRLSNHFSLTAEISNATAFNGRNRNDCRYDIKGNLLNISVGLSWRFGHNTSHYKVIDAAPYIRQNEKLLTYTQSLLKDNTVLKCMNDSNASILAELRQIEGIAEYLEQNDGSNGNLLNDYSGINSLRSRLYLSKIRDDVFPLNKSFGHNSPDSIDNGACLGVPIFFFFEFGSTKLINKSQLINLDEIAKIAIKHEITIEVVGAADCRSGTERSNNELGLARAKYISDYLISKGVSRRNITVISIGGINSYTPLCANRNAIIRLH